jgi:hypothetical protein
MAAPRRFLLLLAGLAVGPTPACLHITSTVTEPLPAKPANTGEFATLPKGPGKKVLINPVAKSSPPASKPVLPAVPTTDGDTEPRPIGAQTANHGPPPKVEPVTPASTSGTPPSNVAEPSILPMLSPMSTHEPPLLAAMRAYVEERPEEALRHLQGLGRQNQEFALAVMPLLVRGSQMNLVTANPVDVAVLVDQFQGVIARLERKAALRVEKVAFCRRVSGFGRYDPWPDAQPYKPNDLAVLYVEIKNVGSDPILGPNGESCLSRSVVCMEIRDAAGKLVEQTDPKDWRRRVPIARYEYADYTRSPVHDYFRTYRIELPAQAGVYTVTVEAKDPAGNRVARSQPVRFDVGGP